MSFLCAPASPVDEGLVFLHRSVSIKGAKRDMSWEKGLLGLRTTPDINHRQNAVQEWEAGGFQTPHCAEVKPHVYGFLQLGDQPVTFHHDHCSVATTKKIAQEKARTSQNSLQLLGGMLPRSYVGSTPHPHPQNCAFR